jgi:hypothetical protein
MEKTNNQTNFRMVLLFGFIFIFSFTCVIALEQDASVVILPGQLDIHSPAIGAVFENRMVPFNFSMSSNVKTFRYQDNDGRARTLCRNCDEYGFSRLKRRPFNDGYHDIKLISVFPEGEMYNFFNFTVETKKPRLLRTSPTRGFTNGTFKVTFDEANPVLLNLNYGNSNTGFREKMVSLNSCTQSRSKRMDCDVSVDVDDYDSEELNYWFVLEDIAGNSAKSRARSLDVDVTAPFLIENNSYWPQGSGRQSNILSFHLDIVEENFDRVTYIDYNEGERARWKTLCTRLKDGICEKKKSFRRGNHTINFKISDDADNTFISQNISFEV